MIQGRVPMHKLNKGWLELFRTYPLATLVAVNAIVIFTFTLLGEAVLRATLPYRIDYYTGVTVPNRTIQYPFGTITINRYGYPDTEFDLTDMRPRIGYVGDSVTYGIGAGQGFRISDLIENCMSIYQHMTFGMVKHDITDIDRFVEELRPFRLKTVIYLMNLNDILPDQRNDNPLLPTVVALVRETVDSMRSKSYIYNYLRTRIKEGLMRHGYGHNGYEAIELFPSNNDPSIRSFVTRINAVAEKFKKQEIKFCIVMLPYEMQISQSAEEAYKSIGIRWDETFLDRGTQKRILNYLRSDIEVLDGYYAFIGQNDTVRSRSMNKIGQYFVYDKGDKLDWNHPNRIGHQYLATYMLKERFCGLGI